MRSTGLQEIYRLARADRNVVFIGSDLGFKVLEEFQKSLPDQFLMEGASEQLAIGLASGLALSGKTVFVNTIASFLVRRCLDQIAINVCAENVNVRLFANGGGFIYGPMGPTHTIIEDIALMMAMPNMAVVVPSDKHQMQSLIRQSVGHQGPMYFRVARDHYPSITEDHPTILGLPLTLKPGERFAIVANGYCTHIALKVASRLKDVKVIDLHTLRPLNREALLAELQGVERLITLEEHIALGGIYHLLSDLILSNDLKIRIRSLHIPLAVYEKYGEQDELLQHVGLDEGASLKACAAFFGQTADQTR